VLKQGHNAGQRGGLGGKDLIKAFVCPVTAFTVRAVIALASLSPQAIDLVVLGAITAKIGSGADGAAIAVGRPVAAVPAIRSPTHPPRQAAGWGVRMLHQITVRFRSTAPHRWAAWIGRSRAIASSASVGIHAVLTSPRRVVQVRLRTDMASTSPH
jgi:hypothetical protein